MAKEKTPKQVYEDLSAKGEYAEANFDKDEAGKAVRMALEDYAFGREIRNLKSQNWRVIFTTNYDALRELCDQLMRFRRQKTSNHQGVFAFVVLEFPGLELDWAFFEKIRTIRNHNRYLFTDISREMWKGVEAQFDVYISTLRKELERILK